MPVAVDVRASLRLAGTIPLRRHLCYNNREDFEAAREDIEAANGQFENQRDPERLQSSLARPAQAHAYGLTDLHALAAKYAHGIASAHPFVDGNKRTAFLAAYIFLKINGLRLMAPELDATRMVWALADGSCPEEEFASWLQAHTVPVEDAAP